MKRYLTVCIFAMITVGLTACTSARKSDESDSTDLVASNDAPSDTDLLPKEEPKKEEAKKEELPPAPPAEKTAEISPPEAELPVAPVPEKVAKSSVGETPSAYTVQKGDTLMKIAFEKYGDLYQWKKILDLNKDIISGVKGLSAGTVLKLDPSFVAKDIDRNGERYLIKSGDTLGVISDDVYGTQQKWRKLWENNKQMIKDPNRIYAGFYLYYLMTEQDRLDLEKFRKEKVVSPRVPASN